MRLPWTNLREFRAQEGAVDLAQRLQHIREIFRQRRFEMHAFAGARMNESKLKRVQHHTRRGKFDQFLQTPILPLSIREVAGQRKAEKLKMHTNLVRAPGMQPGFDKGGRAQT